MAKKKASKAKTVANHSEPGGSSTAKGAAEDHRPSQLERGEASRWTFFSNHAHVLICLYQDSQMVLRDLAGRVGITERAVQGIVQDLEDAGFIKRERVGRRNHYQVIHDKPLRHPIEEHCTVDMLFNVILENSSKR